jgi:anthranilate 1,2-dioxygenase small subunit
VSSIQITGQDNGVITARSNYVVFRTAADAVQYGATEVYSTGEYQDTIVFEDGKAKFTEKVVLVDTCRISSLLVTPL